MPAPWESKQLADHHHDRVFRALTPFRIARYSNDLAYVVGFAFEPIAHLARKA